MVKSFLGPLPSASKDLIKPGDPADKLLYVIEGQVMVMLEDEDGKEIILAYLGKGDFIGEMGLFAPQPRRSVCIRARSKCELAEITYSKLEHLLDNELKDQARGKTMVIYGTSGTQDNL